MPEQEKGFVVKDRRMFSQEGQSSPPEEPGPAEPQGRKPEDAAAAGAQPPLTPLPEINFPTFIASLNASALVHLGVIEDPVSGKAEKNRAPDISGRGAPCRSLFLPMIRPRIKAKRIPEIIETASSPIPQKRNFRKRISA